MSKPSKILKVAVKEKAFVEEYLVNGFNATDAYAIHCASKRSKSRASHNVESSKLLRKPSVQQFLSERLEQRKREIHADQNYVVNKFIEIVECDVINSTQYLTMDELDKMPKNVRKLVTSIDSVKTTTTRTYKYGNEKEEEFEEKYKVTFMSKDKALDSLAKHTGTFMKDNITLQGNIESKSFTDALKEMDI